MSEIEIVEIQHFCRFFSILTLYSPVALYPIVHFEKVPLIPNPLPIV